MRTIRLTEFANQLEALLIEIRNHFGWVKCPRVVKIESPIARGDIIITLSHELWGDTRRTLILRADGTWEWPQPHRFSYFVPSAALPSTTTTTH